MSGEIPFDNSDQFLAKSKALFDLVADHVMITDRKGVILYVNSAFERTTGYCIDEVLGRTPRILNSGTHGKEFFKDLWSAILQGEPHRNMVTNRKKNGDLYVADQLISPVADSEGGIIAFISIWKDMTEHYRLVHELRKTNLALRQSNEDLEQFAYVASHDLQAPLRQISGFIKILTQRLNGKLDEETEKYLVYIADGASRMRGLIQDLLEYSRIGKGDVEMESVNLEQVLEDLTGQFELVSAGKRPMITFQSLPAVQANRGLITQLLQNLISNAIKYCRQEVPEIEIAAIRKDGTWEVSVRDNGIGIAEKSQDRIFQIFQRLHKQDEYSGSGIGLAICRRIIERHHGRIWVESEPGRGSKFKFTLPDRTIPECD